MKKHALSSDKSAIHYTQTGTGNPTLVFVHGWLGNQNWWADQCAFFEEKYQIVRMDLGGHGKSDKTRTNWTSTRYADDIKAVVNHLNAPEVVLIGHSMAGAYVLEAAPDLPVVKAIVLVDTLHDLDQIFTYEQAETFLFENYRKDFAAAIETLMPQFLFTEHTPPAVKSRLQKEFLQNSAAHAINALGPLYKTDVQSAAKAVKVPVRAINSDAVPTSAENNRKYLADYDFVTIEGTGHYPMLENPEVFNELLDGVLLEVLK